jgi:hypothetical protein
MTEIGKVPKRTTLKEFIDENDKLLTAMGVMGALAALFTTVKNGQYLAFLAFTMLLVLDVELVRSFYALYKIRGWGETLIIFDTLLEFLIGGVGLYVVTTYPFYSETVLTPLLLSIITAWLILVVYRNRRLKKA